LKILLDTHIWIWAIHDSKHLGKMMLKELRNKENEIWLSPISTWEAFTLHAKGRITLGTDLAEWLTRATVGTREAPLTHEIALAARNLPLHRDPADRFLAATALVLDLVLATADQRLLGLGQIQTLANR
jgi:PIN domain nuclease of toxin-antitoxin system